MTMPTRRQTSSKQSFLGRLEALYLNMLRVVIIVLATVMLAGTVIGVIVAGPMLLASFGGGQADAARLVRGDSLDDFLGQGRRSGSGNQAAAPDPELEDRAREADRRIRQAAANITRYISAKTGVTPVEAAVTDYIQTLSDQLPERLVDRYGDSILSLSQELAGRPSTSATLDVDRLIDWHFQRFQAAAEEAATRDASRAAEAMERRIAAVAAGTMAVTLFGLFLLMVFVFVLVKIERNLRLMPVVLQESLAGPPGPAPRDSATGVG